MSPKKRKPPNAKKIQSNSGNITTPASNTVAEESVESNAAVGYTITSDAVDQLDKLKRIGKELFGDDSDDDEDEARASSPRTDDATTAALRKGYQVMSPSDPISQKRSQLAGKVSETIVGLGSGDDTSKVSAGIQKTGKTSETTEHLDDEGGHDPAGIQTIGKTSESTEHLIGKTSETTEHLNDEGGDGDTPYDVSAGIQEAGKMSDTVEGLDEEYADKEIVSAGIQEIGKMSETTENLDGEGGNEDDISAGMQEDGSSDTTENLDEEVGNADTRAIDEYDEADDVSAEIQEDGKTSDTVRNLEEEHVEQDTQDSNTEQVVEPTTSISQETFYEGNRDFENVMVDSVIRMPLVQLALFFHSDDTTVLAQPMVNHRSLSIRNLSNEEFQKRMQLKGNDFGEEMHMLVYELRVKPPLQPIGKDAVPIFSTYVATPNTAVGHQLDNVEAIYPTLDGLKQFQKVFSLRPTVKNVQPASITGLFEKILKDTRQSDLLKLLEPPPHETLGHRENNTEQMQVKWQSLRRSVDSQPIRLGIIGGLQRCGLVVHMLGNNVIANSKPKKALPHTYNFKSNSSLKAIIPVHLIYPEIQVFDGHFLEQCAAYSKTVTLRKYEALQTTIKAQLFDIIASPEHPSTTREINDKRMVPTVYWTTRHVSKTRFGQNSVKLKIKHNGADPQ